MTHNIVKTKFLIEYDKAIFTSSYPSLTDYEIATLLDKAYLALIAQKITGNNSRQALFESDTKAIEDIRPLIKTTSQDVQSYWPENGVTNVYMVNIPDDLLYYVSATTKLYSVEAVPNRDSSQHRILPITIVSHDVAKNFFASSVNMPWVKTPVAYFEGNKMYVVYDSYTLRYKKGNPEGVNITYIHKPSKFVDSMFDDTEIEISDTMVEELINLAIVMAAEIVESPRLTTKAQTKALEA